MFLFSLLAGHTIIFIITMETDEMPCEACIRGCELYDVIMVNTSNATDPEYKIKES